MIFIIDRSFDNFLCGDGCFDILWYITSKQEKISKWALYNSWQWNQKENVAQYEQNALILTFFICSFCWSVMMCDIFLCFAEIKNHDSVFASKKDDVSYIAAWGHQFTVLFCKLLILKMPLFIALQFLTHKPPILADTLV